MTLNNQNNTHTISSRRHFLSTGAFSLASVAAACVMRDEGLFAAEKDDKKESRPELAQQTFDLKPKQPDYEPKAKAMISLWMQGGPSHLDLFDPKPVLSKLNGKKYKGDIKYDNAAGASPILLGSPWKFKKHGQCGTELSELLPHLAKVVDDITVIRSMHTGVNNHGQSIQALQTGRILSGRPTVGSWLTYALGSVTQDLPAYMALIDPGSLPVQGVQNWTNGFLPSLYQGTVVRPKEPRILNLDPPPHLKGNPQQQALAYLKQLNQQHLEQRQGYHDLSARIASYELAEHMQQAAKEAMNLNEESKATQKMYGMDNPVSKNFGSRCLIARRLVERGVRCIQLFTRNQQWDHHGNIRNSLPASCKIIDQPSAALVADLKQRGLLDSTAVQWGGEMGRLPVIQKGGGAAKVGRDHNTYGFSWWVAGGGFKGGHVHGTTDDIGHKAVDNIVNHYDYHKTLLHLFGFDAGKLIFERNGREQSLIDNQGGRIVKEILA